MYWVALVSKSTTFMVFSMSVFSMCLKVSKMCAFLFEMVETRREQWDLDSWKANYLGNVSRAPQWLVSWQFCFYVFNELLEILRKTWNYVDEELIHCDWGASAIEGIHKSFSKWNPRFYNHRFTKNKKRRSSKDYELHGAQRADFLLFGSWFVPQGFKFSVFHAFHNWPHFCLGDCCSTDVEWVLLILGLLSVARLFHLPWNSQGNAFTNKQLIAWNAAGNLLKCKQKKIVCSQRKKLNERKPLWGSLDVYGDIAPATV